MAIYGITFRIADRPYNGHSYDDRRDSLIDAMHELNPRLLWEDSTSFFLLDTRQLPPQVRKHIESTVILDPIGDLVFGFTIRGGISFVIGLPDDKVTLEKLQKLMRPST